jgi:raffinose/stachyose/melibiose transport system permease protein
VREKPKASAVPRLRQNRKPLAVSSIAKNAFLAVWCAGALYPFLWVVLSSFREGPDIKMRPFALPTSLLLDGYVFAWIRGHLGIAFINSLIISAAAVTAILVVSSMAAYVLARVRKSILLYTFFTMGIMVPLHTILIPTFVFIKSLNLLNTRAGAIIMYTATGLSLSLFILVGFMKSIPTEIEESASIDGCSRSRTFLSIILPLSRAGIATVGTLTFLNVWNEYLFAFILLTTIPKKTIQLGIYSLQGSYGTNFGPLCAALTISILPVVAVFIAFQRQVIAGMTAGAVKG